MELEYTYWEADDGWFVGYLNDYPDHLTQGHDLAELEEMLADVYQIRQEEEKRLAQKRKSGILKLKVSA
ncbi:hypothetical protein FACS189476_11280 [Spirochaetia bacterium]|nr:hypothetical protein FACS1894106_1830 [Spirochaetia bacterium]GHU90873.1 hypothetical protein FACS189476_11280 [Spirochaetia bacterium]